METNTPVLELKDATRRFESGDSEVLALNNVDLKIYRGEFVAIVGQSGSGKSTMMNVLGCLDRLSEGQYLVNGQDVSTFDNRELAALRRDEFGFIFQRYNLLAGLSARANVEVPAVYQGTSATERHERSEKLLGNLGLSERIHFRPNQLSGGQQQRVAIARALMNEPSVILADEPTGALDRGSSEEVMKLIRALHEDGHTIILITHDLSIAANAEREVHLQDGEIIKDTGNKTATAAQTDRDFSKGMNLQQSVNSAFAIAFQALRLNWFRTALTLLGIIIGVGAVIALMALGNGQKQDILGRMTAMGTNLISVYARGGTGLSTEDAKWIARIDGVDDLLPSTSGGMTLRFGSKDTSTNIQGVTPSLINVRDWPIGEGQFFSEDDVSEQAPVIVLGQTTRDALFEKNEDPIGQYVLAGNFPLQVIGVMSVKGSTGFGGDQDDTGLVPLSTAQTRLFGSLALNSITVKVSSIEAIDSVENQMNSLLLEDHSEDNFRVRNMASFVQTATETATGLTLFLAVVAAISLIVGGIGVMNIMLVSVTERTREIGVRMATGARQRDILLQFLIEAITVCALGGVIGLALGWLAGYAFAAFGMTTIYTAAPSITAFVCAVAVGVIFGFLPARKASRLDPVEALMDH